MLVQRVAVLVQVMVIHMPVPVQCVGVDKVCTGLKMVVELVVPVITMIRQGLGQVWGVRSVVGCRQFSDCHQFMTALVVKRLVVGRDRLFVDGLRIVEDRLRLLVDGLRLEDGLVLH
jgi:hypothetical protein